MRYLAARALVVLLFGVAVSRPAGAEGTAVADATESQKRQAEKKLSEGKKLFESGKFDRALERFREAHAIVKNPDATMMMARAHRDTGDLLAARAKYRQAVEEAEAAVKVDPKYEPTLEAIRKDLADLDGILGKLTVRLVHAPPGTNVSIDGEPIDAARLADPQLVIPGSLTVLATAPDGSISKKVVTVNGGQSTSVELAFVRDREPATFFRKDEDGVEDEADAKAEPPGASESDHTLAFLAGGVGLAGLAGFGVFGLLSKSKYDELTEECASNHCSPDRADDIDDGRTFQTVANIGLGVGIAGVAASAALFVFTPTSKPAAPKSGSLTVSAGFRSVQVRGSF